MASGVKHGFGLSNDGVSYVGEFKNGLPHGNGKLSHRSGAVYVGKIKQGMKHGYGKLSNDVDGRMYEGQWRKDRKHGHGMFSWPDSHMYEGQWRHGLPHGHGKYTSICKESKNFVISKDPFSYLAAIVSTINIFESRTSLGLDK